MNKNNFLIYGCYGYTGTLITRFAAEKGLKPILAGRNAEKVKALAEKYNFDYKVFDLSETDKFTAALKNVDVLLHCAGPFEYTYKQAIEVCLATKTHYLDITGEVVVFEGAKRYDKKAKEAGIMVIPGTGFDVVPTDCLAYYLKEQLPDAHVLELAFSGEGGRSSHGTALTAVGSLGRKGAIRKNGKLEPSNVAAFTKEIPFSHKKRTCASIPWGDISTAYTSTGIPNIKVFMNMPPKAIKWAKRSVYFRWLLGTNMVQNFLKKKVKQQPAGPSDEERKNARSYFWGMVKNPAGVQKAATMETPEGYTLTALMALNITNKVLSGNYKAGYQTPATAYGSGLILEAENVKRLDITT